MTFDRPRKGAGVVHRLPGRLRLHVHALHREPALARGLERELSALPGVMLVRAAAATGSLLVLFTPPDREAAILEAVSTLLASRASGKSPGDTPVGAVTAPDLLAGLTAVLAWSWGRGLLGLGILTLAGWSRSLRRDVPVPPALGRKINLMTGLTAAAGAAVRLAGGERSRVLAGLVAGNPLAFGPSAAAALAGARARLARDGIFLGEDRALPAAAEVDTLVFTAVEQLPPCRSRIGDLWPVDPAYDRDDVVRLLEDVHRLGVPRGRPGPWNFNLRARLGERDVIAGTAAFMKEGGIPLDSVRHLVRRVALTGGTPLFLAVDGHLTAVIGVEQEFTPRGWDCLQQLRCLGIKHLQLLTAADDVPVTPLNAAFDEVAGGLTQQEIAQRIGAWQLQGHRVALVTAGDGPAADRAHLPVFWGPSTPGARRGVFVPRPEGETLPALFFQAKLVREHQEQDFLSAMGGHVVGLSLATLGRLGTAWAFAFEVWSLAVSTWRRYAACQPLRPVGRVTRSEVAAARVLPFRPKVNAIARPTRHSADVPRPPVPYRPLACPSLVRDWHSLTPRQVLEVFGTDVRSGMSDAAARERLVVCGYNELPPPRRYTWWELFRSQLGDFMVQLLLAAAGISALTGRGVDALTVVAIVLANASVGVWQELRAEKSLAEVRQLAPRLAVVRRDGRDTGRPARDLVPGDLVLLEAGSLVPADLRLLEAVNLEVEESSLTGETWPVPKSVEALPATTPLPERTGMVYAGSCVVRGRGLGVVVGTGAHSEMGSIALSLARDRRAATALQRDLGELGRHLAYACLAASALCFGLGILRRQGALDMLLAAISLAVSAMPEGLLPMVTIGLGMAVFRMSRRNLVIRRLAAVETLGSVTTIGVDKTGTITRNEMTVREVYAGGRRWAVTGEGYDPRGEFRPQSGNAPDSGRDDLEYLLLTGMLCNNAGLNLKPEKGKKDQAPSIQGDPTEAALLVAAAKAGLSSGNDFPRLAEEPFDARERQMAVVCGDPQGGRMLVVKGAPDRVMPRCTSCRRDGKPCPMEEQTRREITAIGEDMAARALRVLALAYKPLAASEDWRTADGLVLAGLVGMQDPPRPEVPQALNRCRRAGVAVVMITGDHPRTAAAIAREIGLLDGGRLVTGMELDAMDDPDLDAVVDEIRVCARALPRHKLRLVRSLQRRGHVVAMAGDGVNDAPAVQQADIGLAMGRCGTDLTKGVADMVIADDNFATIVRGIEEGRAVYANIRTAVAYLLYTNAGDLVLMLTASVLGLPLPLVPIQLLWINLSGDSLPALAIMADPPVPGQMRRPPRPKGENLLAGGLGRRIVTRGTLIGLAGFAAYRLGLARWGVGAARTMALASLGTSQFLHLFDPAIQGDAAGRCPPNKYKAAAGVAGLGMILASVYVPGLRGVFQTVPLSWRQWLPVLATAGVVPFLGRALEPGAAGPPGRKK